MRLRRLARLFRGRIVAGYPSAAEVRNIALLATLVVLALGAHFYYAVYPSLIHILIDESEQDAVRAARVLRPIVLGRGREGTPAHRESVAWIETVRESLGVAKIKVFDRDGRVTYSTDGAEVGQVNVDPAIRGEVARGRVHSRVLGAGERSLEGERFDRHIVETYVPVMDGERFDGAFEVYYDITVRRQDLDGRLRAMNMSLGLLLSILLAMFAAILTRSYTTALRGERAHSRRLHEEIEHRLRVETELRESHGHFVHMAHHDPLTGMPNRTLFFDRFDHALANARRYGTRLALLFIDLDRFKSVNDTYGHEAGDALLKAAAAILLDNIRESDTAARIAGDEFAVLIEHAETVTVDTLVARLAREFASELDLGGAKIAISASIGISLYPQDGDDVETLLHRADIAMYRAKGELRGSWQYFDGQIQTQGAVD